MGTGLTRSSSARWQLLLLLQHCWAMDDRDTQHARQAVPSGDHTTLEGLPPVYVLCGRDSSGVEPTYRFQSLRRLHGQRVHPALQARTGRDFDHVWRVDPNI